MARYLLDPFSFIGGGGVNLADSVEVYLDFGLGGGDELQETAGNTTFFRFQGFITESLPVVNPITPVLITAAESVVYSWTGSVVDSTPTVTFPTLLTPLPSETVSQNEDHTVTDVPTVILTTTAESKLLLLL